jgi:hypothetical protein
MSAFLCDFATFDYLAEAAKQYSRGTGEVRVRRDELSPERWAEAIAEYPYAVRGEYAISCNGLSGQEIGRILWAENWRSLNARYPDTKTDRAGAPGNTDETPRDYRFRTPQRPIEAVKVIKAAHCLSYQSCETEDYYETFAAKLLQAIERNALYHLPGYEDAPWGLTEADVHPLPVRRA